MNKLLAVLVASVFSFGSASVLAADPPKATTAMKKMEKPANVSADAWAKMTDAEKHKAIESAKPASAAAAPVQKQKKGGC